MAVFDTTLAVAPLSSPTTSSPWIALVNDVDLFINVIFGKDGLLVVFDSNIAWTLKTSGTFKDISSSWTLVPYTSLVVKPSPRVFWPVPDPLNWDLLIVIVLHLDNVFFWVAILVFFTVATKIALVVDALSNFLNVTDLRSAENTRLASFNFWTDPSE